MASFSFVQPMRRSGMFATLMGAVMLAGPLAPARAQTPPKTTEHPNKAARHAETVEQRIASLHAALKITPAEETDWQAVAQTIRDNAAALQKLAADKKGQNKEATTAIEDLQAYETFAQAHVDGLKSLITSFQTLYTSMPDEQKKLADEVFRNFRQRAGVAAG